MCLRTTHRVATSRRVAPLVVWVGGLFAISALGQNAKLDWRRVGNTALDLSLASVATGPVDRVWYSQDGSQFFARTTAGRAFTTTDFENWAEAPGAVPPAVDSVPSGKLPEDSAQARRQSPASPRLYAFARFAYRSEDGGATWSNLTGYRNSSLLGDGLLDLVVSPRDADEIVVGASTGVWRSVDGGLSWTGLNSELPNLQTRRILSVPSGVKGMRVAVDVAGTASAWEWNPGEKQAWRASDATDLKQDYDLRQALGSILNANITALAISGDYIYLGSADGQLWASVNRGTSWTKSPDSYAATVERIWVDAREPRLALAALGNPAPDRATATTSRVLRTVNGGGFWDDLTADLPTGPVHGIAADRTTGAVYAGTSGGLFMTYADLTNAGPATPWTAIRQGLPSAGVTDVALDPPGNQLYVAYEGYGVFAAPAPHRDRDPRVVSAADFVARAAAPGTLLSVIGADLTSARAGSLNAPVLAKVEGRTDIQVPFEAAGSTLPLTWQSSRGAGSTAIPLRPTSPAIFVDRDGAPMLLDADTGVMLDAMTGAHSNSRIQILATGLGRVRPDWPAGTPAPAENTPRVIAPVKAYLDREPVEVTRAALAPGYVGFYLVEIQMPKILNYGPAELYIEADGQPSNRVRMYIEP